MVVMNLRKKIMVMVDTANGSGDGLAAASSGTNRSSPATFILSLLAKAAHGRAAAARRRGGPKAAT